MYFEEAMGMLRSGKKLRRAGWSNNAMYVALQTPDVDSKMNAPYLYIRWWRELRTNPRLVTVPWTPSQIDLFGDDWEEANYDR
jgi:hypothetical protein